MYIPEYLKSGDNIGITAPSAGFGEQTDIVRLESAKLTLSERGYNLVETDSVRQCEKGRSADGRKRAEEFQQAVETFLWKCWNIWTMN